LIVESAACIGGGWAGCEKQAAVDTPTLTDEYCTKIAEALNKGLSVICEM
jgi:hypothetical protein